MPVTVQWDDDAPVTGQPDAGSAQKVYTEPGAGTVTVTDEAVGGPTITLNYTVPLGLTVTEPVPAQVDSAGDAAARTTTVAGEAFPASATGTVAIATGAPGAYGTTVVSAPVTTDASGVFTGVALTVPQGQDPGDYHIEATFGDIADLASALTVIDNSLAAPTNVISPSQTTTTANITWDAVTGADGYVLRWKLNTAEEWTTIDPATSPQQITGLAAESTYNVQVMATDSVSGATSPWGPQPPLNVLTPAQDTLAAPENFAPDAANVTDTQVPFSWEPVTGAASYIIQYRTGGGEWTPVSDIPSSPHTVTGLTANTAYEFQIRAVGDGVLPSPWAPTTPVQVTTAPSTPTGLATDTVTAPTADSVTLTWNTSTGADAYTIRWDETGQTQWNEVAAGTAPPFTVGSLPTAGQAYDFQIRADVTDGPSSAWSTTHTESTTAA